jgi:hypothetical protein
VSEAGIFVSFWIGFFVSPVLFGIGYTLGRWSAWKDMAVQLGKLPPEGAGFDQRRSDPDDLKQQSIDR